MKKGQRAIYYVTDKNIFDALNEHKVDGATVAALFERRNTLVSHAAPRRWLAEYFSRLTHDYYDHKDIAQRLGIVPRRERITSIDVSGIPDFEQLKIAIQAIKDELESHGDVVRVTGKGRDLTMHIEYSTVDYRRSEFNQVQQRDGEIEFHATQDGYVVRNTQNDYINSVRDMTLGRIVTGDEAGIERSVISLFAFADPKQRSLFFFDLFSDLQGYDLRDVTDVHVFKGGGDAFEESDVGDDSFVERISLRGRGVTRSEYLSSLGEDDYYVVRAAWRCKEKLGKGDEYALEALFADPKDCTGFSYIVLGVYDSDAGVVSAHRRAPNKVEIALLSRVIETRARYLMSKLSVADSAVEGG